MTFDQFHNILNVLYKTMVWKSHWCSVVLAVIFCCCFQGILGTINSGKSALVHRYLTGSYMQEESPEGRNFKLSASSLQYDTHLLGEVVLICLVSTFKQQSVL